MERSSEQQLIAVRCECSNRACRERILLTANELDFARGVRNRVVVKIGHAHHRCDRVLVEEPGRFQVIATYGRDEEVVAHLFPDAPKRRSRPQR